MNYVKIKESWISDKENPYEVYVNTGGFWREVHSGSLKDCEYIAKAFQHIGYKKVI